MIDHDQYSKMLLEKVKRPVRKRVEPGSVVGFFYSPERGHASTQLDLAPLLLVVEAKFQYLYGPNLWHIPNRRLREQIFKQAADENINNMELAAEIKRNINLRNSYNYYRFKQVQSPVIVFDKFEGIL